jgi:hypothetical protein
MTDLPTSPDDELVNAVLDDAATPEERAQVAADPSLTARLAELRRVRDAVASPVRPLDEVTARRLLDTALRSADPHGSTAEPPGATLPASARRRDHRRREATLKLVGIAAAVLLAALAVPVIGSLGGSGSDDSADETATVAEADQSAGDDAAGSAALAESADSAAEGSSDETFASERGVVDLGTFPDVEAVVAEAGRIMDRTSIENEAEEAPPEPGRCPSAGGEEADRGAVLLEADATVDGELLLVRVWSGPDDAVLIQVLDPSTCAVVVARRG